MHRTRRLVAACLAIAALCAPAVADAYPNGQIPRSELAPIFHPSLQIYLADDPAAAFNTMRLCSVTVKGLDLYPGGGNSAYRERGAPGDLRRGRYGTQWYFWELYKAGRGNLAAYPGTSQHGDGKAVDLATHAMRGHVDAIGMKYGWRGTVPSEWWHVGHVVAFGHPDPGTSQRYPVLRKGSGFSCVAGAVRELEKRLGLSVNGKIDYPDDVKKIRVFQDRHGLKVDGVVGEATWKAARADSRGQSAPEILKPPAEVQTPTAGIDVKAAQGLLNTRFREMGGPCRLEVDGVFGAKTEGCVRAFQALRAIGVDGRIGDETFAELREPARRASGPDVSNHQGSVDWTKVRADGHDVAFVKASEGQDYRDSTFTRARVDSIRKANLAPSVYHFLRPRSDRSGATEADWFVRVARGAGYPRQGDVRPVADIESTTLSASATCAYVDSFNDRVHRELGVRPIVYTYPSFASSYLSGCSDIKRRTLWLAAYQSSWPKTPRPWGGWTIWQHTDRGSVAGIRGGVDENTLPGGRRALDRLRVP